MMQAGAHRACAAGALVLAFAGSASAQPATPHAGTAACAGLATTASPQALSITVEPRPDEIPPRLVVTVRMPAAGRSVTPVMLPQGWAGASGFAQGVRNLRVVTPGARLLDAEPVACPAGGGDGATAQRMAHARSGELVYSYDLVEYGDPLLTDSRRFYQPLVRPDYAFFFGYGAWLLPRWNDDQQVQVQWTFARLPAGWSVANSF
jgi:hypothetical protein